MLNLENDADVSAWELHKTVQSTENGPLGKLLRSPEYNLFPLSAVFESDFIQVTKKGNNVDLHNIPITLTLGVTSTVPSLPLPNILLIARMEVPEPDNATPYTELSSNHILLTTSCVTLSPYFLCRIVPLKFVKLTVCEKQKQLLKLRMANGKSYYLLLDRIHPDIVFLKWTRLIHILRCGLSTTFKDPSVHMPQTNFCDSYSSSSITSLEDYETRRQHQKARQQGKKEKPSRGQYQSPFQKCKPFERKTSLQITDDNENKRIPRETGYQTIQTNSFSEQYEKEQTLSFCYCNKCDYCLHKHLTNRWSDSEDSKEQSEDIPCEEMDYGLWERDAPALMPLSRLSGLIATGRGFKTF
ncbi:Golgi-associated RAB2 interactor protein 1A-like [Acipenser ruthenus]|uniref:Golgi-associated RAB2 interactor protein 1A-like n=1 Tax=Acipenser ruthenus TaxID=7906 RepID=UPI001560142E|nr:Golgi-associated RAB2 interactor protein 1A-like [Acipenser ruthenus]